MIIEEKITTGHARALLAFEDPEQQLSVANEVFDKKLSVRETEKLVKQYQNQKEKTAAEPLRDEVIYKNIEEKMKTIIGTKVSINRKDNNKGKIEIEYYSSEELERIMELFESIH